MGRRFGSSPIEFEYVRGWEKLPDGFSHFDVPAVCTDPDGNVYLYCRGDHPVLVYDREGHLLDAWGPGKLTNRAHGICADPGRGLFLVDEGSHSVGFHDSSGQLRQEIGPAGVSSDSGYDGSDFRTITRGAGPFNRPTSLAIAPSGDLYVSDGYGNSRIHQFTRDGALVRSWGEPGQKPGQFHIPHDVWVHTRRQGIRRRPGERSPADLRRERTVPRGLDRCATAAGHLHRPLGPGVRRRRLVDQRMEVRAARGNRRNRTWPGERLRHSGRSREPMVSARPRRRRLPLVTARSLGRRPGGGLYRSQRRYGRRVHGHSRCGRGTQVRALLAIVVSVRNPQDPRPHARTSISRSARR